jgi:hypothetical protein
MRRGGKFDAAIHLKGYKEMKESASPSSSIKLL